MGEGFAASLSHVDPSALELLCSGGAVQDRAMGYQTTCKIQPVGVKVSRFCHSLGLGLAGGQGCFPSSVATEE